MTDRLEDYIGHLHEGHPVRVEYEKLVEQNRRAKAIIRMMHLEIDGTDDDGLYDFTDLSVAINDFLDDD